jgi:hypothetical protein
MGERNPPIVIHADILFSLTLAAVLVKYIFSTLHFVFICATVVYRVYPFRFLLQTTVLSKETEESGGV